MICNNDEACPIVDVVNCGYEYDIPFRAETIHRGFDFVRFFLLGSEFDSFSVFRFGPFLFLAIQ